MKRNWQLIRDLLVWFEDRDRDAHAVGIELDGHARPDIQYHLILLHEAGLLSCQPILSDKGRLEDVLPFRLTWAGHELLALMKTAPDWGGILREIETAGDLPMETVVERLKGG